MRRYVRRIGITSIAATVVAGAIGSTQAGVIPWLYDAIFGPSYPRYPYAYSASYYRGAPYAVGYSPCGPAGCGVACGPAPCAVAPCATACAPSPCGPAGCGTAVSYYGPCDTGCRVSSVGCEPRTVWSSNGGSSGSPPAPPTFANDHSSKKPVAADDAPSPGDPNRPGWKKGTATQADDPGFGGNKAEPATDADGFAPPKTGNAPSEENKPESSAPPFDDNKEGASRPLNLDSRTTWTLGPKTWQRTPQQARFRDARVARRTFEVNTDDSFVPRGTAIVRK